MFNHKSTVSGYLCDHTVTLSKNAQSYKLEQQQKNKEVSKNSHNTSFIPVNKELFP